MNIITNYLNQPFYLQYENPEIVLIAISLIVYIFTFTILDKIKIFDKRVLSAIVAIIISLFSLAYIPQIYDWTASLNIFLILAIIGIFILIGKPFFKFLRKTLGF